MISILMVIDKILNLRVSGGQFMNYNVSPPALCNNPPCATFEELSTEILHHLFLNGNGVGYFEWITSLNHVVDNCAGDIRPSLYTFVIKVQDDFCWHLLLRILLR